jgi:hypothetical protein
MVLGIISVVFGCLPFVGLVCGTIAIVLYVKFNADFERGGQQLGGRGMAIAGLVTGIVGAVIGSFSLLYFIFVGSILGGLLGSIPH